MTTFTDRTDIEYIGRGAKMGTTFKRSNDSSHLDSQQAEQLREARRIFEAVDRFLSLREAYAPGQPMLEETLDTVYDAFNAFFQYGDTLAVRLDGSSMYLRGARLKIWETSAPADICGALSEGGVYLLFFLPEVNRGELREFFVLLSRVAAGETKAPDVASALFDADLQHITFEALDPSLASVAGIDSDLLERDTKQEREEIERLYESFLQGDVRRRFGGPEEHETLERRFELEVGLVNERRRRLEMGSRQLLRLSPEIEQRLKRHRRGLETPEDREERAAEILSSILAAGPKPALEQTAVERIGALMSNVIESEKPWIALDFLRLIHKWRDEFDSDVISRVRDAIHASVTTDRIQKLVQEMTTTHDGAARQSLLKMFDALGLEEATQHLVEALRWDLNAGIESDILRYLERQASDGFDFLERPLDDLSGPTVEKLVDIAIASTPESRSMLLDALTLEHLTAERRVEILEELSGTWETASEIRDHVVPLLESPHPRLRIAAVEALADGAPQHAHRVLEPHIDKETLSPRSEEEIEAFVVPFVKNGRSEAIEHLEDLVRRRGVVGEDSRELASTIALCLMKVPAPPVKELLESVANDWLVPGSIRSTCQKAAELLR